MNIVEFVLISLYVCWTTLIFTKIISIRLSGNTSIWNPIVRTIWCICTTAVVAYAYIN